MLTKDNTRMRVEPITPFMGARVTGIDAAAPMDEALKQQLRETWWHYGLLHFPGQNLDEAAQLAFASIFGQISEEGEYGPQHYVSNVSENGLVPHGELAFHVDHSWSPTPLRGLMLYGIEVPPEGEGGDTLFADAKRAWELLPSALKERLRELQIVHTYPDQSNHVPIPGPDPRPGMPTSTHPLAYPHPATGEIGIFCSARHFDRIVGWSAEQSLALAQELVGHISKPEIIHAHKWHRGDLILWDNLRLQHARTNFDRRHRRHLRRTQIGEPLPA
jgi:taurine dioxygenase